VSASAELRRRRADEVINRDYLAMRDHVIGVVAGSLRRRSIFFVEADLDAHYNTAWQGLYNELLAGKTIENPQGFLVTIVIRRAIDDARRLDTRGRAVTYEVTAEQVADVARDFDVAARLDDHIKLRQFVEGLKERLTKRELEAAALCYIHGYSRPEAAAILSVEPKRMEKIMDAVSKKVGGFVRHIEAGAWCDSRRSLMNAYAFGVLDRNGERYRLASEHLEGCPACRRYVRVAQGLAAVVPPISLPIGPVAGDGNPVGALAERMHDLLDAGAHSADRVGAKAGASAAGAGGVAAAGGGSTAATGGGLVLKAAAVLAAAVAATGGGAAIGLVNLPARADGDARARTQAVVVKDPASRARVTSISLPGGPRTGAVIATKAKSKKAPRKRVNHDTAVIKRTLRASQPSGVPEARRDGATAQTVRAGPAPARAQGAPSRPANSEFDPEG
jgi:DNA-directed RNA polymerase specialized sigma24 family protein